MVNNSQAMDPISKPEVDSSDSFMARAANVLTCLSEGKNTLSEIAKTCKMGASSAHRLLATLTKPGLVIYDQASHRYYLGPRVAQLTANPVTSHQILIMAANHEMARLSAVIEETTTLSLMVGIQYIPLHSVYSNRRLVVLEEFRGIRPVLPLGSTDLILLSQLDEKELHRVLEIGYIWQGVDPKTKKDTDYWIKYISRIRKDGYVVTRGEKVPGGLGVSAPVENYFCPVALTIIGPEHRLEPVLSNLIKELMGSAQLLSGIIKQLFPAKPLA